MENKISKKLLNSEYRKNAWKESKKIIEKLEKVLPISSIYLRGSFTAKKTRPADVDFIILLKTKENNNKAKWSADFVVVPDNGYGDSVLKDAEKWMKQKYGAKNSETIKLK